MNCDHIAIGVFFSLVFLFFPIFNYCKMKYYLKNNRCRYCGCHVRETVGGGREGGDAHFQCKGCGFYFSVGMFFHRYLANKLEREWRNRNASDINLENFTPNYYNALKYNAVTSVWFNKDGSSK
jgi:hypothetical protein